MAEHVDESVLDESGPLDVARRKPLLCIRGEPWTAPRQVAPHGFTRPPRGVS